MPAHTDLSGKVALVTGAGPGLGRACAVDLARAGARVAVCDIAPDALEATVAAVRAVGGECLGSLRDVSSSAAVAEMFAEVRDVLGSVDILVNNAARTPNQPEDEARRTRHYTYMSTPEARTSLEFTSRITDREWHRYWDVNVHGVFYCTREALRMMEPRRAGKIINVASIAGLSARSAHSPHYSATKGAVIAFTRSVAAEVAGANIFVNAIAPGGVATPEFNAYLDAVGEQARARLWQNCPLGRFGTPEEYASLVTYLAGDHYLVGQVISPNGGSVV
ncbi:SDR family NAD(P)-dependent oxidoreductase [Streptomyces sp. NPDC005507]|uniref:SDR family NAD(P)-dependent oxidoreductase n=1 Tax=unclassified Streptomyces TaxID=2593676 RepID=UPI0033B9DB9C